MTLQAADGLLKPTQSDYALTRVNNLSLVHRSDEAI